MSDRSQFFQNLLSDFGRLLKESKPFPISTMIEIVEGSVKELQKLERDNKWLVDALQKIRQEALREDSNPASSCTRIVDMTDIVLSKVAP